MSFVDDWLEAAYEDQYGYPDDEMFDADGDPDEDDEDDE